MDFEKKYRDLVEAVKELQEANPSDDGIQNWVNDNVPELAESEDERIRKEIISALKYANHKGVYDKHLAWLEKQGEKKSIDDLTQQEAMDIAIAKCFEQGEQKPVDVRTTGYWHVEDVEQKPAAKYKVGDTVYYNSFGRLVSFVIANIVEDGTDNPMYEDKDGNSVFQNDIVELKSTDNVEPKFKVGDWTVNQHGYIRQIIDIKDDCYYCIRTESSDSIENPWHGTVSYVDEQWHKWSIKDAKDGDVLVSESNCGLGTWYCIFKSLDGDESMTVYCYLTRDGRFETKKELCFDKDPYNTKPATKEQHDQLEKAMTDAGYTFDFDKKELKKIEQTSANEIPYPETLEKAIDLYYHSYGNGEGEFEHLSLEKFRDIVHTFVSDYGQKPNWSEEDEKMCQETIDWFEKKCFPYALESENPARESIKWLKSLKDRVQPKQEWSKEDKTMLCYMEGHLEYLKNDKGYSSSEDQIMLKRQLDWLKSLRPQLQWKPSERQKEALLWCVVHLGGADKQTLGELLEELNKL